MKQLAVANARAVHEAGEVLAAHRRQRRERARKNTRWPTRLDEKRKKVSWNRSLATWFSSSVRACLICDQIRSMAPEAREARGAREGDRATEAEAETASADLPRAESQGMRGMRGMRGPGSR